MRRRKQRAVVRTRTKDSVSRGGGPRLCRHTACSSTQEAPLEHSFHARGVADLPKYQKQVSLSKNRREFARKIVQHGFLEAEAYSRLVAGN